MYGGRRACGTESILAARPCRRCSIATVIRRGVRSFEGHRAGRLHPTGRRPGLQPFEGYDIFTVTSLDELNKHLGL